MGQVAQRLYNRLYNDCTKTVQWNKVLRTEKSMFETFCQSLKLYVRRRVGERATTLSITPNVKLCETSIIKWVDFSDFKVKDLHQEQDTWNQTDYHSI